MFLRLLLFFLFAFFRSFAELQMHTARDCLQKKKNTQQITVWRDILENTSALQEIHKSTEYENSSIHRFCSKAAEVSKQASEWSRSRATGTTKYTVVTFSVCARYNTPELCFFVAGFLWNVVVCYVYFSLSSFVDFFIVIDMNVCMRSHLLPYILFCRSHLFLSVTCSCATHEEVERGEHHRFF